MEHCFDDLDAPVERITGADIPMPYAINLEALALPKASGGPPPPPPHPTLPALTCPTVTRSCNADAHTPLFCSHGRLQVDDVVRVAKRVCNME